MTHTRTPSRTAALPHRRPAARLAACGVWAVLAAAIPTAVLAQTQMRQASAWQHHASAQQAISALRAVDASVLREPDRHAFAAFNHFTDPDGRSHTRVERRYAGMPVIGGELIIHRNASGGVEEVEGALGGWHLLNLQPQLTADAARALSAARTPMATDGARTGAPRLVVFVGTNARLHLAWDVMRVGERRGKPSRLHSYVDAHTGEHLGQIDDIMHAHAQGVGHSQYLGEVSLNTDLQPDGQFALRDTQRHGNVVYDLRGKAGTFNVGIKGDLMLDADNNWGDGSHAINGQTDGVDAAFGLAAATDYFKTLGLNSWDNAGAPMTARVNSSNQEWNAFWSDYCKCIVFTNKLDDAHFSLTTIDFVAHEYTHAVSSKTARFTGLGESGALNEGSSDIFGTMTEFFVNHPRNPPDYTMGEGMYGDGSVERNFYRPSLDGHSADCYTRAAANGEEHYGAGILNHWFYLLAEGSQPKTGPASPTCTASDGTQATGSAKLQGIGRDAAARIYWRALSIYIRGNDAFTHVRAKTIRAATDLYGATSMEVARVKKAWSAVKVK